MALYSTESIEFLADRLAELEQRLTGYKHEKLELNMARGKPCTEQLDLSNDLLDITIPYETDPNKDYRNYGTLDGLLETRAMFAEILEVDTSEVIVGGNSSLNMMYSTMAKAMLFGTVSSPKPWGLEKNVKWLCPVPGYDRHFSICELYNMEMIPIEMDENGPDMDMVEELVKNDPEIKGMWCVPKYSNPSGITYSDEVVRRLARMETAAPDFRIYWDNAYVVHDLYEDQSDELLNIMVECKDAGHPNRVYLFTSMSKVTFAGAAVAAMALSEENHEFQLRIMGVQTIGSDKINQYRHVQFLRDLDGVKAHMRKHAEIIRPKFEATLRILEERLGSLGVAKWSRPIGGYFINLDVLKGSAFDVEFLASSVGLKLTPAGSTYPYRMDPNDSNIRIAPTFPPIEELEKAIDILCDCIEISSIKTILSEREKAVVN